jgi:hypothetical protein
LAPAADRNRPGARAIAAGLVLVGASHEGLSVVEDAARVCP